ncbi:MAG: 5'-nucleotidase C-terminal domain-containing protein [Chthonomonas sp.]|nr:5'-nucleotidase C-terminal domain-containing protein [Chthonomonas sp.]
MRSLLLLATCLGGFGLAYADPDKEAHGPSQDIADLIREAAGAEAAIIAAGMIKEGQSSDLATFLRYPTDEIAVVELKGSQIRQALAKSVSLYPSPYDSFLQLSNMDASFKKSASPDARLEFANLGGQRLDDKRSYQVAMPATLARGGLGFFRIWDKNQIKKTLNGITLESVVKGKAAAGSAPRWRMS